METVVQKYGGTSVESIKRIKSVAKRIAHKRNSGKAVVVVVSAMGKMTNELLAMARQIARNPRKRELDALLSTGEQQSIALLSMALNDMGYDSVSLTGYQAGIKTVGMHTKDRIEDIDITKVLHHLSEGKIVVVAGFQGVNQAGDITTLGRGGSDTTAVALAAKLNCVCEIYTDVDGVYAVDPRLSSRAKKIHTIAYEEMMEMASLGAKIMEVRAVELGYHYKVPIYVTSSKKDTSGTLIEERDITMEEKGVTGLTVVDDILMITVSNVAYGKHHIANLFEALATLSVNIDMISQSTPCDGRVNISFTCPAEDAEAILQLQQQLGSIIIEKEMCKLSLIGIGMMNQPGVASQMFRVLSDNEIAFRLVTTSEISVSFAIDTSDKQLAVKALAEAFELQV